MARPSHVRNSVRELLEGNERHDWSIEDLHARLLRTGVTADYSSVFRAVGWLQERGVIAPVSLGDGRVRYELAGWHHDHVRCDACGKVSSLPECLLEQAGNRVEQGTGFIVTSHRLVFSGLCPSCR
ncbi:MAG TPA: transcriptional repressor [Candidatus Dormibacteraeota bacterium]